MDIQNTRLTAELASSGELNKYLDLGWVLILSYAKQANDAQQPRFIVAWQQDSPPAYPEILDRWEERELDRLRGR